MGIPFYGQSFTLASTQGNGLGEDSYGGGTAGEFTRARGFLAYYEICHNIIAKGWKVVKDPKGRIGPYAYKGTEWVGFDDIDSIKHKTKYIKEMGLGGAMIWALDLDDFRDSCGCEKHPLLKTINRVLGRVTEKAPDCTLSTSFRIQEEDTKIEVPGAPYNGCDGGDNFKAVEGSCSKFIICNGNIEVHQECPDNLHFNSEKKVCDWPENANCAGSSDGDDDDNVIGGGGNQDENEVPDFQPIVAEDEDTFDVSHCAAAAELPKTDKKVVCYFTNWAWYRNGQGKYTPDHIDPRLCTHINYGFAVLDSQKLVMKPHDTWADLDNDFYKRVTALKKCGVKVLIALGGWNDSADDKYSRLVSSPTARERFVNHAFEFVKKYNFDGLDLDWEYPKCWQVNCDKGPDTDKANFASLVEELRAKFGTGYLLSAAVSPSKKVIDAGYDVEALSKNLDIINVMTYDYYGHWDGKTGHVAPLFDFDEAPHDVFNAVRDTHLDYIVRIKKKLFCCVIEIHHGVLRLEGSRPDQARHGYSDLRPSLHPPRSKQHWSQLACVKGTGREVYPGGWLFGLQRGDIKTPWITT